MKQDVFRFFLVVPPGFEDLAVKELRDKCDLECEKTYGGLELECSLKAGFSFNHVLKIPARVLLRLDEFKCKDFPKLFNMLKKVKFTEFLPNRNFTIKVSSQKSRLLNEKRILQTAIDAFKPELNTKQFVHTIYIRAFDDNFTVSIDTTGELLHKRGEKELVNQAPIRENIASGLLLFLLSEARMDHGVTIVDPMCGSGTFLLEAGRLSRPNLKRIFAYQKFKNIKPISNLPNNSDFVSALIGFDIEKANVILAKSNLKNLTNKISARDVFSKDGLNFLNQKNVAVITNPPYGKKIKLPKAPNVYYVELINALTQLQSEVFGCIVPRNYAKISYKTKGYKNLSSLDFENGGIPVTFLAFKRE